MSDISTPLDAARASARPLRNAAAVGALIMTLILVGVHVVVLDVEVAPYADDGMRLVQVRDLLAGQGWYDVTQYRLGLESGTAMHWSRLVDAPIAAIVMAVATLTGDAALAETVAAYLWPALTLFLALWAIAVAAARVGSEAAIVPAMLLAGVAFAFLSVFQPGAFDHHNVQIMLAMWLAASLVARRSMARHYAVAGMTAVLMLAIGIEALPYVAMSGLWVALALIAGGIDDRAARAFGWSLIATSITVMAATVAPSAYGGTACDSFSLFHVSMASVGGLGLVLTTRAGSTVRRRLTMLGATGAVVAAMGAAIFPHCLHNPLSSLDPAMIAYWLDMILETRSLADHWQNDPFRLVGLFGMPLCALVFALCLIPNPNASTHRRLAMTLFAVMVLLATAITAWQQRAYFMATAFSVVPLALMVVDARARLARAHSPMALAAVVMAWIVSTNTTWWMLSMGGAKLFGQSPILEERLAETDTDDPCFAPGRLARIASLPTGVIAAPFNGAVPVLLDTDHRVIAGNYHRNTAGNLAWIALMTEPPAEAEARARRLGLTHVLSCTDQGDPGMFAERAPDGLQAALFAGAVPDWLEPMPAVSDDPLTVYRVIP